MCAGRMLLKYNLIGSLWQETPPHKKIFIDLLKFISVIAACITVCLSLKMIENEEKACV